MKRLIHQLLRVCKEWASSWCCVAHTGRDCGVNGKVLELGLDEGTLRVAETRRKLQQFPCHGNLRIQVMPDTGMMILELSHLSQHPQSTYRNTKFPKETIEFLAKHAMSGLRRSDLYNKLVAEKLINPLYITRMQLNYWHIEVMAQRYVHDSGNQLLSSKLLLESSQFTARGFKVVMYEDSTHYSALGWVTPFFQYKDKTKEVVTNSTFKTNVLRFELFIVTSTVGGFVISFSYLLFLRKYEWKCKSSGDSD